MLSLNNNYFHRFSNAKHVYCITNNNVLSIQQRTFYSVPYKPTEIDRRDYTTINNVIVAYIDEELCSKHINLLKSDFIRNLYEEDNSLDSDIIPFKLSMSELKQLSKFIGMPVAILLNEELVDDKLVYNVYINYMRDGEEKDYTF